MANMSKAKLLKFLFSSLLLKRGPKVVDKMISTLLWTVLRESDIDDNLLLKLADGIKESIPGEEFEPILGHLLIRLGTKLGGSADGR